MSKEEVKTAVTEDEAKESLGKTRVSAVYRLIFMMLALLNQFLVLFGLYPVQEMNSDIVKLVSLGLCIITGGVAYWKNNSWSPEAKAADKVMESMRNNDISITDVLEIMVDISKNQDKKKQ